MSETATTAPPTRSTGASIALAVVSSFVVAGLLNFAVAAAARALGASPDFRALTPPAFLTLTLLGAVGGAIGWSIIRRRARDPYRVLSRLVPALFVLSLVPDVLVGVTQTLPGATWTGVIALMTMHLIVTVCVVAAYQYFMPVRKGQPAA